MLYNLDEKENVRCFSTELHEDDYQIDFQGGELHGVLVITMAFKKLLRVDSKQFAEAFEMLKNCNPDYYKAVFDEVYKEKF